MRQKRACLLVALVFLAIVSVCLYARAGHDDTAPARATEARRGDEATSAKDDAPEPSWWPAASASFFKPTPQPGYFYVQRRSEGAHACDAWLRPEHAHTKEIDFPIATHQVCHQHKGWTRVKKFKEESPQACKDWYNRHPADDGVGAHCWEDPMSWSTSTAEINGAPNFMEAYFNSAKSFGNALSCNDPQEAAEGQNPAFDVNAVAKSPVRTEAQRMLFEKCLVAPFCEKMTGAWKGQGETKISQASQDVTVADIFNYKTKGIYIDIGASDGIEYSNSFFLDKCYGWTGLMVDANWIRYMGLAGASRSGDIVYGCVMDKDCTQNFTLAAGLSSVDAIEDINEGGHSEHTARRNEEKATTMMKSTVPCYNFNDLVMRWMKHRGIDVIDYLTIDIEGAEWHALRALDLSQVPIRLIGVETDYTNNKFVKFLKDAGYTHLKPGAPAAPGLPSMNFGDTGDAFWWKDIKGKTTFRSNR